MKIFIDTADLNEIKELASWGVIDGATTNPTLVKKSGRSFDEIINGNIMQNIENTYYVVNSAEEAIDIAFELIKTKD